MLSDWRKMCPFNGVQSQGYVILRAHIWLNLASLTDKRTHYRTLFQLTVALKGVRIPIDPLHLGSRDQIFP